MASIRKRKYKNGTKWEVRIRKPPYPTLTKHFSLKVDAENWASETGRQIERGEFESLILNPHETVTDIIERYQCEITPHKRGRDVEYIRLRKLMENNLSKVPVNALKPIHIIRYRDERLALVSSGTVKKELVLLGHVIEVAIKEWGVGLPSNPVRSVKKPKENRQRYRRLEDDELTRLLSSATASKNIYLSGLVEMAIETGMRRGELLSLQWSDIDAVKRTAHLPMTKNGTSRTIPLSKRAAALLEDLPTAISGKVFPIGIPALRGLWLRVCKRAGIVDLHFHDLRHEATSRFFELGLNVMEVAAITGHKDLRMLQRYTHLKAEDLAKKLR